MARKQFRDFCAVDVKQAALNVDSIVQARAAVFKLVTTCSEAIMNKNHGTWNQLVFCQWYCWYATYC